MFKMSKEVKQENQVDDGSKEPEVSNEATEVCAEVSKEEFEKSLENSQTPHKSALNTDVKSYSKPSEVEQLKHQMDSLKKELASKHKLITDYADHLRRLQAEFENYSKRVEKEKKEFQSFATHKLILDLLIVVDEFRLALSNLKQDDVPSEFFNGVQMIFNNLHKTLEKEGVKEMDVKGKPFNPYEQEALLQVHVDTLPDNIVVEELQKGYLLKDKVLRYAKVKVNNLRDKQ